MGIRGAPLGFSPWASHRSLTGLPSGSHEFSVFFLCSDGFLIMGLECWRMRPSWDSCRALVLTWESHGSLTDIP